jgi:hypothetical protein
MQQFVHTPKSELATGLLRLRRRCLRTAIAGAICLAATACGGAPKQAPTKHDVATIAASLSDIVFQCQSVAAGYVASADSASIRRDVDALLGAYHRVRPDAPFAVGAPPRVTRHTTLRKELSLAQRNLSNAGCSPAQARRIATAVDHK